MVDLYLKQYQRVRFQDMCSNVCALAGSLCKIVNYSSTGTTVKFYKFIEHLNINITHKT